MGVQGSRLRLGREDSLPSLSPTWGTQPRQPVAPQVQGIPDPEPTPLVGQSKQTSLGRDRDSTLYLGKNSSHRCGGTMISRRPKCDVRPLGP